MRRITSAGATDESQRATLTKSAKQMGNKKHGVPNLISQLIVPIVLVVVVGIAQIAFAVRVLTEGKSTSLFVTIITVGMILNMGLIVYTASSIISKARSGSHP